MRDYLEASFKMDKFMPDDEALGLEFGDAVCDGNQKEVVRLLNEFAEEEVMFRWFPKGGTVKEFAEWLCNSN